MERDVEGFGQRLLDDAPRRSIRTGGGWTRAWSFLIWTWTIDSGSGDWLVEMVQRRFLGEEVVHRYSRTVWLLMAWGCVAFVAIMLAVYGVLAYLALTGPEVERLLAAELGLAVLPAVVIAATIAYFTFVPPKEYRSSRGG